MDQIAKVVQINLASRTDRLAQIEEELRIFPSDKVVRLEAIQTSPGCIGCQKSHRAALRMAMDHHWPNVLIVEDDLQFINQNNFSQLQDLMRKPYDVILLGATFAKRDPQTSRVKNAQTATAYVVHENQQTTLYQNMCEGIPLLEKHLKGPQWNDQYWKRLQEKDQWLLVHPCIVIQRPSQSDNERKFVDQLSSFNTR